MTQGPVMWYVVLSPAARQLTERASRRSDYVSGDKLSTARSLSVPGMYVRWCGRLAPPLASSPIRFLATY